MGKLKDELLETLRYIRDHGVEGIDSSENVEV